MPNRSMRRRAEAKASRGLTALRAADGTPVVCRVRDAKAVTAVVLAKRRMRGLIADRRQIDIEEAIASAKETASCAA